MSDLESAFRAREPLLAAGLPVRLFAGFSEGDPSLTVDLFGRTLVVHDYGGAPAERALELARALVPNLRACVHKLRRSEEPEERRGKLIFGEDVDRNAREEGVRYALDILGLPDCGFYLDTRLLRAWAKSHLADKRVLNTFAHTGSLGVAARAAGASLVVHTDKSKSALDLAKQSYSLNGYPISRADFVAGDFFPISARLRKEGALFDCVFVDPPYFSQTAGGRVDLETGLGRLLDKARPLVGDGGALVVVCNALWVSGAELESLLSAACADGYMNVESRIDVPEDVKGYARALAPPTDPAPWSHPTKIAVLRVKRKDGRAA